MSKPMRRTAAIVATAALAVSLSACTAGQWVYDTPPAAGNQTDNDGLKLRNFIVVSNDAGEAVLLGSVTSRDEADAVQAITVAPESSAGEFTSTLAIPFTAEIPEGKTITLGGNETAFTDENLVLGRLARVAVTFSSGAQLSLDAPVASYKNADFAEAWAAAQA